jgi:hypothetical protein
MPTPSLKEELLFYLKACGKRSMEVTPLGKCLIVYFRRLCRVIGRAG